MQRFIFLKKTGLFLALSFSILSCREEDSALLPVDTLEENWLELGGGTTLFETHTNAFSLPAPGLDPQSLQEHLEGDVFFEDVFVKAPSPINPGLGPIFNNNSCIQCHPNDGRAKMPENFDLSNGFFLLTSMPGQDAHGGPLPVPGFGIQIQNQAVFGFQPEAKIQVRYEYSNVSLSDGTVVELRKPLFSLKKTYIPMPAGAMFSPRMSMPVFGLGLVEAIPDSRLLALADPNDQDGDGISGRVNRVWNPETQQTEIGRFGWKAGTSTIRHQSAAAYSRDMGITNVLFPIETGYGQTNGNDGLRDDPELPTKVLDAVSLYCRTLAVPAARDTKAPNVRRGYTLFTQTLDCARCHTPSHTTGPSNIQALANQKFWPFSDFLLHDMGESLADHRPEYQASGTEWRTRPLWGIGLTSLINGHTNFLHDGRARNITEAILWHGGEAQTAREKFRKLKANDRQALLDFLESL